LYNTVNADNNIVCGLDDSAAGDFSLTYTSTDSTTTHQTTLSLVGPLTTSGSTVTMFCSSDNDTNTSVFDTHLTAIKVGSVSGALGHFSSKALSPRVGG
jgi:hypothetical protein